MSEAIPHRVNEGITRFGIVVVIEYEASDASILPQVKLFLAT